ncbi:unnamed protein product [Sympodiomycopsis kandeliae]
MLPWSYSAEDLQETKEYYPGQEENAEITFIDFYYNSYKVPGYVVFAMYIAFVVLVVGNGIALQLIKKVPSVRTSRPSTWLRGHLFKSPIAGAGHHAPLQPLGRWFLSFRTPLRFEMIVVILLVFVNVLPLAGLYRITPSDVNVYWPGPTSHRDQQVRYLADRSANLAMGQLPLIILMSGRNSPIAAVSGLDFNSLMLWHRWLARMCWLQVNVHSFAYTAISVQAKTLSSDLAETYWRWGCVATAMFWALTILAVTELRKRAYEVWLVGHVVFAVLGLVGTWFHIHLLEESSLYVYLVLIYISTAVWAFDRLVRVARRAWVSAHSVAIGKGLMTMATVETMSPDVIKVEVDLPISCLTFLDATSASKPSATKIAPGHSVRLLAPKVEWLSDHPFTVAHTRRSPTDPKMGQMTLWVKAYAGMTRRLLVASQASPDPESASHFQTPMVVEGPYGDLHNYLADSEVIVLFAGGIGITFCLPIFTYTAFNCPEKQCKLVWNVKTLEEFAVLREQLLALVDLLRQTKTIPASPFTIDLHVTEEQTSVSTFVEKDEGIEGSSSSRSGSERDDKSITDAQMENATNVELQPFFVLKIKSGRSINALEQHVDTHRCKGKTLGLAACGPASLCDDVRLSAKRALLSGQWGDVDHVEECFNW